MSKILVIVESPKKAKEIQKYLGDNYVVCACNGHVIDLTTSGSYPLGIDIDNSFKPIYGVLADKRDKVDNIIKLAKGASEIFQSQDPDREGEGIAMMLTNHLKQNGIDVPIKRVLFHEITKAGIKKGISNVLDINPLLADAQQARRVLDRLVGYLVSPFVMETIGPGLSAGRVQSVAVRLIVDREREIENFKPDEYWPITATFIKDKKKFSARLMGKITNKNEAQKIKEELEDSTFKVIDVTNDTKEKDPPPPLTTSSLQQAASRKFRLSSDATMAAAQALYESGRCSYIRTDSIRSSPESILSLREWLIQNKYSIPVSPNLYTAKDSAQDAHEAIRPTDINDLPADEPRTEEEQVYSLIWKRFVASQMNPARYTVVTAMIRSGEGKILKANGKTLLSRGWLDIIGDVEDKDEILPELSVNDILSLSPPKIKAVRKLTQAPSRYKTHSLVQELESKGIGRPSTYASIIGKITQRNYVEKKQDVFYATKLGKSIVDLLSEYFDFMKFQYTAEMENKLDAIAEGKLSYCEMMNSFFPAFKEQLVKAKNNNQEESKVKCPLCSSNMRTKEGKFGAFYTCSHYPLCRGTAKIPSGIKCSDCGYDTYYINIDSSQKLICSAAPYCKKIMDIPIKTQRRAKLQKAVP